MYLNYEIRDFFSQESIVQIAIVDWEDFIGLLFPKSRCTNNFFNFKREEVLSLEEIEILDSINVEVNTQSNNFILPEVFAQILEKLKWKSLSLIEDQIIKEICSSSDNESKIEKIKVKLWQSWQGTCGYFDVSIGFLRYRTDNQRLIVTIVSA